MLPALGLGERIQLVRRALREVLPDDFGKVVPIMVDSLGLEIPQTRKYYSGRQEVELQINGKIVATDHFIFEV